MTGEQFLRRRTAPSLLLTRKLLADAREGEVRRPAGPATVSSEETEHGRRRCDQGRSRVDSTLLAAKKRDGIP
jgi:hypothetical protein